MVDTTILFDDFVESLSEQTSPTADDKLLSKKLGETTKYETRDKYSSSNALDNKFIDGDFNHNQMGGTTGTAFGYYTDVWSMRDFVGTTSVTVSAEIDSDINKNKIAYSVTSGQSRLRQYQKGVNKYAGESLSSFVKVSSTSGVTTLAFRSIQNFGSGGSSEVATTSSTISIPASTTERWFRIPNLTVPSISGKTIGADNYIQLLFQNTTTETIDITYHAVRCIVTPENLPDSSIPEWIKQDEDAQQTLQRVLAYYWQPIQGTTSRPLCQSTNYTTTQAYGVIDLPVPMVQSPTLSVSAVTDFRVLHNSTATATTVIELGNISDDLKVVEIKATVASGLTAGHGSWIRSLNSGSPTLAFDARY